MTPLINGVRHAWADIKINLLGATVTGVTKIMYEDTLDIQDNYGAGSYPTDRGEGNYKANASITLKKYELERLQAAALSSGGSTTRIQEIPEFDIVVAYMPKGQDVIKTDVIRNCRFTKNMRDAKQGDTNLEFEIPLLTSHILWFGMTE